jgi:D-arabinose 1-dehydrogenase-like Zn-dependent alcohol dehydrogenase
MGFNTVAIARGKDKEELVKLGGAKIILATVPSGKAMGAVLGGLAVNGKLIMIGALDEPLEVSPNFSSPDVDQ